ncbi:uncharacterized protein LOC131994164 [Stomoxys calcitrans]|uniref:uncharacterized protein LOC131994164 n=1 Tax=Stomoxys calcitrans TaxID=35570 RepID=UPI0027E32BDE|nr:uncharacterized protein LOC131994164 [Stomoxys calcitrans]
MRNQKPSSSTKLNEYVCRICRQKHALRKCKRFLNMNTAKRLQIVQTYGYCRNCLAHSHSQGSCFTKTGCKYCQGKHHSLLHLHPRLKKDKPSRRKQRTLRGEPEPKPSTSAAGAARNRSQKTESKDRTTPTETDYSNTSLSAILKQNLMTLLPTAVVKILSPKGERKIRCLLDTGSKFSYISKKIVDSLGLTTLTLEEEAICPLTLVSIYDSGVKIDTTLRMNNRINIHTPSKSLPRNFTQNFHNLLLSDEKFCESAPIDVILGVDIYSRVITEGILIRTGLPTAQNTIFGWTLYGSCSL